MCIPIYEAKLSTTTPLHCFIPTRCKVIYSSKALLVSLTNCQNILLQYRCLCVTNIECLYSEAWGGVTKALVVNFSVGEIFDQYKAIFKKLIQGNDGIGVLLVRLPQSRYGKVRDNNTYFSEMIEG